MDEFEESASSLEFLPCFNPYIPVWACDNWGNYGHDWLDCFECLTAYQKFLDQEAKQSSSLLTD